MLHGLLLLDRVFDFCLIHYACLFGVLFGRNGVVRLCCSVVLDVYSAVQLLGCSAVQLINCSIVRLARYD